jgi:pilus assembly protein CpaB
MRSKVLIVVVAIVIGGIAAVLAASYLRGAQADIAEQNKPVEVLVAVKALPRGLTIKTLIEQGFIEKKEIPAQFVVSDAISSDLAVTDQVLASPVSAGEQLTRSRFDFPADAGLAYTVPEERIGMSISVDDVSGVAGLLKPGDNVVVFVSYEAAGKATALTTTTIGKALVLAVGGATSAEAPVDTEQQESSRAFAASNTKQDPKTTGEAVYKTITLSVTPKEAEEVAFAQEFGSIHLGLLPQNAQEPKAPKPVTFIDVYPKQATLLKAPK